MAGEEGANNPNGGWLRVYLEGKFADLGDRIGKVEGKVDDLSARVTRIEDARDASGSWWRSARQWLGWAVALGMLITNAAGQWRSIFGLPPK